jgi:hypothetical protein
MAPAGAAPAAPILTAYDRSALPSPKTAERRSLSPIGSAACLAISSCSAF